MKDIIQILKIGDYNNYTNSQNYNNCAYLNLKWENISKTPQVGMWKL